MALPTDYKKVRSAEPGTRIYFTCVCKAVTGCTARKVEDRMPGPPRGKHTAPPAAAAAVVDAADVAGYVAAFALEDEKGPTRPKRVDMHKEEAFHSSARVGTGDFPSSARMEMRTVVRLTTSGFHNHPSSLCLKRRRRRDAAEGSTAAAASKEEKSNKEPLSAALQKPHSDPAKRPWVQRVKHSLASSRLMAL
ncbi:unnamed protein product [Closterium sp. Naga37s-1]|nr:unnamed protein product [Closterium sp. Naga37s-1]